MTPNNLENEMPNVGKPETDAEQDTSAVRAVDVLEVISHLLAECKNADEARAKCEQIAIASGL